LTLDPHKHFLGQLELYNELILLLILEILLVRKLPLRNYFFDIPGDQGIQVRLILYLFSWRPSWDLFLLPFYLLSSHLSFWDPIQQVSLFLARQE